MVLEKLFYSFSGRNIIIGRHIKAQLEFLEKIVPEDFKRKKLHDLGCGDGKITFLLQRIFRAEHYSGYDFNEKLIKLARKRGIEAKVLDIEKKVPGGEMAVIWGVLHHLKSPKKFLKMIKDNYQLVFLREPLKRGLTILELGKPFQREEIKKYLDESFGTYRSYIYDNAIFAFWEKRNN